MRSNIRHQLRDMRKECASVPSVPAKFMKSRKKAQEDERLKRRMNGNTRRMMTEIRISNNIVRHNDPRGPNTFKDVLVSGAGGGHYQSGYAMVKMASAGI